MDSLLDFIKLWLWTNDNDKIEFRNSNSGCNSDSVRFRKMLHARTLIRYQDRKSDLQQIERNCFETDQVCLLVNNFKNEYHSDRYLGKSREWVFGRDQWTARTSFLIFEAQSSVCLDALLHDFHCWCIDCKCLGKIKNWQNGETDFSSLIHTTQKDFQIDSRALIGWD